MFGSLLYPKFIASLVFSSGSVLLSLPQWKSCFYFSCVICTPYALQWPSFAGYSNCLNIRHIIDRLVSVNVNHMSITTWHVELVVIAYYKAVISTPHQPALHVSYLQILFVSTRQRQDSRQTLEETAMFLRLRSASKNPTENKRVGRHTSVYWCDCLERCWVKGSRDGWQA
jgi:hypothetical protein